MCIFYTNQPHVITHPRVWLSTRATALQFYQRVPLHSNSINSCHCTPFLNDMLTKRFVLGLIGSHVLHREPASEWHSCFISIYIYIYIYTPRYTNCSAYSHPPTNHQTAEPTQNVPLTSPPEPAKVSREDRCEA